MMTIQGLSKCSSSIKNALSCMRHIRNFSSVPDPIMPPCDFHPPKYEGIQFEEVNNIRKELINPTLFHYYKKPLFLVQGHMQWLFDDTGKRYLDLFGGIVTVSVGHCHPKVKKVAVEQLGKLWHTTNIYYHPNIHEYAKKLTERLPGNLKVCFFTNSGSEANDLAVLMSRMYTGNFDVVSLRNSYHGMSPTTMALTAISSWKHDVPSNFGVTHTMNPDPYRGIWGGSYCRDSPVQTDRKCSCSPGECEAANSYANELNDVLKTSINKKGMAAFFAESIQGVGGTVQFPKGFLKKAYEHVRARGGLCVADEVQTGFGRLGTHYWGFQTHDVMPDIVCIAKGMGNGFPIGGVVTTPEIAKTLANALHFNTYGGNPVSTAVASKVLDVIDEEHLQENCKIVGTHFLHKLAALRNEFEIVGDVRGKGLMIGVEFVTDKESRTPLPVEDYSMIQEECKRMGVLIGNGGGIQRVMRIKPPMCITRADADYAVAVLRKAIQTYVEKKL